MKKSLAILALAAFLAASCGPSSDAPPAPKAQGDTDISAGQTGGGAD